MSKPPTLEETLKDMKKDERTEPLEGVEQPLVSPTRSGKEPGDAEQRSVESRAVPPGEATTSALLWAMRKAQQEAGRHRLEASLARAERMPRTAATHERFAVTMDKAEAVFRALMEEPDSDADHQGQADE